MEILESYREKYLHLKVLEADLSWRLDSELLALTQSVDLALKKLHDDNIKEFEKQIDTINSEIDKLLEECEKLGIPFDLINSQGTLAQKDGEEKTKGKKVYSVIGRRIGDYEVLRSLGGEHSDVYLARGVGNLNEYAIRIFESLDQSTLTLFYEKIKGQNKISSQCENVVPIENYGISENNLAYCAMKYMPDKLADKIRLDVLAPEQIESVLETVAYVMDIAHENGVVHGNLSPDNIFFDDGKWRISGFGFPLPEAYPYVLGVKRNPVYSAPEVWEDTKKITYFSDIYSFGILTYHLLVGVPPFQADNLFRLLALHAKEEIPAHSKLSYQTYLTIKHACEKVPDNRYHFASQFVDDLKRITFDSTKNNILKVMQRFQSGIVYQKYDFSEFIKNRLSFEPEWREIPAGVFLMGSDRQTDSDIAPNEQPQTSIEIPYNFLIAKTPITNAQFGVFALKTGVHFDVNSPKDAPANWLTWEDAGNYCEWLSNQLRNLKYIPGDLEVRLPTEAEWEKSSRGTDGIIFPWGNSWEYNMCNCAEFRNSDQGKLLPELMSVGYFSPHSDSPYGLCDCSGNVLEWTLSLPKNYPFQNDDRNSKKPKGKRILRGGGYNSDRRSVRCAARTSYYIKYRSHFTGMRVLLGPKISY